MSSKQASHFDIVDKLLSAHRGASFTGVDLHIHTPASYDWQETSSDASTTPHDIVKAALAQDLGLIAITDHNSADWCDQVGAAAAGTPLTVLPGFELTVRPGIHVLALFKEGTPGDTLKDILITLGIPRSGFGDARAMTKSPDISEVLSQLRDNGALVIPAHIDLGSGLIGRLKGGDAVADVLDRMDTCILEVAGANLPPIVSNLLKSNPRRLAIIRGSDAHRIDKIGSNKMWLKMDKPGLEGLKHAAFEPTVRIHFSENLNTGPGKLNVIGLYADGGILAEQVICFNADLNCLIGGRGSGKSAVIDHIRFVLGSEPIDEYLQRNYRKRLVDLIRNGNSVYVLVEDASKQLWLYERTLQFHVVRTRGSRTDTYEITSPPSSVYRVFPKEKRVVRLDSDQPKIKVEIYGQGEVYSLAETSEPARQLKLIDDIAVHSLLPRNERASSLLNEIEDLEHQILELRETVENLQIQISELPAIESRIDEIEQDLKGSNMDAHQIWVDAHRYLNSTVRSFENDINNIEAFVLSDKVAGQYSIPNADASKAFQDTLQAIGELDAYLKNGKSSYATGALEHLKLVYDKRDHWEAYYRREVQRHNEILKKQGVENLSTLHRELSDKRAQRKDIEERLQPELSSTQETLRSLSDTRNRKISELLDEWKSIREIRKMTAKTMSRRLASSVHVEILDSTNLEEYYQQLDLAAPQGIRDRENQLQKVVEGILPGDLVAHIRNHDSSTLQQITGITAGTAEKLLQIEEKNLLCLERVRLNDIAAIYLTQGGQRRSLDSLSDGEKCTAVLSVILLDQSCPLVIDQPEDELDHAFIVSNVVETLANVKASYNPLKPTEQPKRGRQFIISTHNQNIPVLGDAELVHKMRKVPGCDRCEAESSCGLEHQDTIKHILSLEGGHEAFARRHRKYVSTMLPNT